jgi:hypothetical protein
MVLPWSSSIPVVLVSIPALAAGCGVKGSTTAGGTTGAGGDATGSGGIPCDVSTALAPCIVCHTSPPIGGAVGSLASYAGLTSIAPADPPRPPDPGKTMAEMALVRMQDTARPMPPGGGATTGQIQALQAWVNAGTPRESCAVDAGPLVDAGPPDPAFQGGPTCASGTFYAGGMGPSMNPGAACIDCHTSEGEAPFPTFAGTVFAEGHSEDLCLPAATEAAALSQAQVVIVGSDASTITLSLAGTLGLANGNFITTHTLPLPYTAKVDYQGKERAMTTPQTSGDCNACHTVAGTNGAPGRIVLPQQ